jgi:acetyl esterase/lipase
MRSFTPLLIGIFLFSFLLLPGCDVIKELSKVKTAAQIQKGVSKVEGDNSLPGAQKGGVVLVNEGYKVTDVKPNGVRYRDVVFTGVKKNTEVYVRGAKQFNGTPTDLVMDIYTPAGDVETDRPCVIFVFGGGWFMKTVDGMDHFGHQFAQRGYVGVSIDYRYGFPKATTMASCKTEWSGFDEAWYRAAQDAKAAIRYLKANADRIGLNKDKIFIGGHSAGAFTALNAVQLDDEDVSAELRTQLGGLNEHGDHRNESTQVMGNYVLAGGTIHTLNYVDKPVPTYLMNGTCDEILPFGAGKAYHCKNSQKHPMMFTGQKLYEKYRNIGACIHYDVSCRGGHEIGGYGWKITAALVADFVWKTLINQCKTDKRGIEAKQAKCQKTDVSVCKPVQ